MKNLTKNRIISTTVATITILSVFGTSAKAAITFVFDYSTNTPGIGFLDPVLGPARQTALTTAGNMFSNLFATHFTNSAIINLAVSSTVDPMTNTLASAGTNDVSAPGTFGAGEVIPQKLITGVDLNGASADGTVNVNWAKAWELDPNMPAVASGPGANYDFYAALNHEFTHTLGFGSNIFGLADVSGNGGPGSGTQGTWAKWDQFLTDKSGAPLINTATFEVNNAPTMDAQANGAHFRGAFAMGIYGGPVPIENGGTSHLDETTFSTPTAPFNYMMKPLRGEGPNEARTYSTLEVGMLRDLGFTAVGSAPEPSVGLLLLAGMGVFGLVRRKK